MSITEKELREMLTVEADTEKVSTVSSDGRNLLTRIPVKIRERLKLKKGDRLRWLVKGGEVKLEIIEKDAK
ncbi:hypothetical protein A3K73_05035 [Candidatus Pacearchaeota archaeon RBG_13_36_9]|nr:MAG: hypothetical protein A3K73_05035 [Candidatus Pacearchaeota archaeon RBG_13_36_9]